MHLNNHFMSSNLQVKGAVNNHKRSFSRLIDLQRSMPMDDLPNLAQTQPKNKLALGIQVADLDSPIHIEN